MVALGSLYLVIDSSISYLLVFSLGFPSSIWFWPFERGRMQTRWKLLCAAEVMCVVFGLCSESCTIPGGTVAETRVMLAVQCCGMLIPRLMRRLRSARGFSENSTAWARRIKFSGQRSLFPLLASPTMIAAWPRALTPLCVGSVALSLPQ